MHGTIAAHKVLHVTRTHKLHPSLLQLAQRSWHLEACQAILCMQFHNKMTLKTKVKQRLTTNLSQQVTQSLELEAVCAHDELCKALANAREQRHKPMLYKGACMQSDCHSNPHMRYASFALPSRHLSMTKQDKCSPNINKHNEIMHPCQ